VSLRFISLAPRGIVISTGALGLRFLIGNAFAPAPLRAAPPSYSVNETTGAELGSDRLELSLSEPELPVAAEEEAEEEAESA
jgi:hypothetical protein